jgi:uncharacterized protein with GYD domain
MPLGPGGVPTHSIQVPPPHDADPANLRRAAVHLQQCADEVCRLVAGLRGTVSDLTVGGQWRSPIATAFQTQAWAPIEGTLKGLARALEQTAESLMRAARALEDAQSERRKAEALAVAAGVGVALTVLTFGISDVAAAEAAAGAAALMARAATVAAGALRAVLMDLEEAGAAIRVASVTMRTWGTRVGVGASVTLPKLAEGPIAAGAFGALSTAAVGDLSPVDLALATALGMVEAKAGQTIEEEPAAGPTLTRAGSPRQYPYDLERFEGVDRAHVLAVHCRETAPELIDRLRFDPDRPRVSTFRDRATAQQAVQQAIDANQQDVSAWLASAKPELLRIRSEADGVVGEVLTRENWLAGRGLVDTRRLRIVLQRSGASPTGFIVLTAFPELKG